SDSYQQHGNAAGSREGRFSDQHRTGCGNRNFRAGGDRDATPVAFWPARAYMAGMDTLALTKLDQFLTAVDGAANDGSLVRLSLRMPFGADDTLVSVDIKPAL